MARYSFELKVKIVHAYINGEGSMRFLAKKYNVKCVKQVINWVNAYRLFGEEGLQRSRENKVYSVQFKSDAVELYQTSEMSYREVSYALGIHNPALIPSWVKIVREQGISGLSESKGPSMKIPNQANNKSTSESIHDSNQIKELKNQVRELQIQNAILKEMRRLREEKAHSQMNPPQRSFTVSEDNLN